MCGIAGLVSASPPAAGHNARIDAMIGAIAHRGPDGRGTAFFPGAALGHVRLSIIDLAGGSQPMSDTSGRYCIVYNGEIYNYRALRRELAGAGVEFRTASDTEVVLALYAREGIAGLARLRGMYAFGLWDTETRTLSLARDPIGIKPLFYRAGAGGDLAFASEAKAILAAEAAAGGPAPALDTGALHMLLNFRYLPGEATLFQGVSQLAPGTVLTLRPGEAPVLQQIPAPAADGASDVLGVLGDSVCAHLTADVEVAGYLSGGIDSAAVVALAGNCEGRGVERTFTLPFGDDPREAQNAARSAQLLGVDNAIGEVPEITEAFLGDLLWHLEVPKINAAQSAFLARFTARHAKVALSGLGGDELFLGYNMHGILSTAARWNSALTRPLATAGGGLAARCAAALLPPWTEWERAALMGRYLGNWPRVYGLVRNVWDAPGLRATLYGPRMLDEALPDAFGWLESAWPDSADPVAAAARFEWRHKMVNDLLWHEDRVSMAAGLEVRVPFVDNTVYQTVSGLDRHTLMRNGGQKAYMRDMLRAVLPAEIMTRPKSGFQVHAGRFFHAHLERIADHYLSPAMCERHGLFRSAFVRDVRRMPPATRWRWHYFMLYLMLLTHIWLERFGVRP